MPPSVRPSPNPSTDTLSAAPPLTFGASAASSSRSSSRSVHTLRPALRRPDADMDSDSSSAGSDISARLSAPPNVKIPLGDAVEGIRREVREMRSVLNGTASGRTTPKRRRKGTRSGTDGERSRGATFSALGARSADEKSLLQRELEEANDFMTHTPIDSPIIASSSSIMSDSSAGAYPYHWAGNPYPSTYTDIPPSPSPSLHFSTSSSFQSSSHTPHTSLASSVYPLSSSSTNNTGTNTYTYTYSGMSSPTSPMSNGTYRTNSLAFSQLSQSRSMQYLPLSPSLLSGSASVHSQSLASTTGDGEDDVAYRLKLLVQNRYYLPSPHDKPSVRELGGLSVSPSGGITNTSLGSKPKSPSGGLRGLFGPRSRSNSSLNSSPQKSPSGTNAPPLPQQPNGVRSSRSQVFTRAAAGPAPAPSLAVPGTFPRRASSPAIPSPPTSRTPEPKGRVMVIKERVPDLPRAAREARLREEERVRTHPGVMKRREREMLEQSQEWEVDPTEEVDTAPAALKDPVAARVAKVPMVPPRAPARPPPPPPSQQEVQTVGLGISEPAPVPETESKAKSVRAESEWETEDSEYEPAPVQARQPVEVDPEEAAWRRALLHQAVGLSMVEAWPSRVIADEAEDSSAWETEAPVPTPKPAQAQARRPLGQEMYGGSNVDLRMNRQRTPSNVSASAASSARNSVRKVASQPSMVVGPPPRVPLPPLPIPPPPDRIRPVAPLSAPAVLLPPAEVTERAAPSMQHPFDQVPSRPWAEASASPRQSFDSISVYSGTDGEDRKRDTIIALPRTTFPSQSPAPASSSMHERNASVTTSSSISSSLMQERRNDVPVSRSQFPSRSSSLAKSQPGSPHSVRVPSLPSSPNTPGSFKRKPAPLVLGGPEFATYPIPRGPLHPALQKDGSILAFPTTDEGLVEFPTQRIAMTPSSIGASMGHGLPSTAPHDVSRFPINRVASPAMSNFSMPNGVPRASSTFSHADTVSLAPSSKYHSSGARTTPLDQYGFDRRRPITNTPVEPPRSASPSARSFFSRFRKDSNKKSRIPGSTFDLLKNMPASQSTVSLAMTRTGGISSENVNLVANQSGRSGSSDAGVPPPLPFTPNTPTAAWTRSQNSEDPAVRRLDGMLAQHVEAERERMRQIASGISQRKLTAGSARS
ncbi:hypothetical protein CALVIDRAFT_595062 [Calocera viscosa TUFC12733]|uniref:Uncharacterized protein n=1 Tax=Calocera viscosa (strain TUFC12733) TaxID=1330018 RepID=A0A167RH30_CALVF|nr:hypothetical protein CALVIDRAFT_595062 [Calocera viscosa TUFC12733]